MDWIFDSEYVVMGEGKDAGFYTVNFCNGKPVSVQKDIERRWKSCGHYRTVWHDADREPGKKVAAVIAQALANREKKKAEKKQEKLENVHASRTATTEVDPERKD
jgi:hypothetical protein